MKKRDFLLVVFLLFYAAISSQIVVFQKSYNLSGHQEAKDIIAISDEEFFIAGQTKNNQDIDNILIMKLDDMGDTIWTKTYCGDSISYAQKIIHTSDDNYLIAGGMMEKPFLLKINSEGDSLWSMSFPCEYECGFKDVIQLPNSDLILIKWIFTTPLSSQILRIDSSGNIDWIKDVVFDDFRDIKLFSDNEFLLSGWEGWAFSPNVFLRKYDISGNLIFYKQFLDFYGQNKCLDISDQNIFLGCGKDISGNYNPSIIKTDFQGNSEIWFDLTGIPTWWVEAMIIVDNDYIITGSEDHFNNEIYITALNLDGEIIGSVDFEFTFPIVNAVKNVNEFLYVTGNMTGNNGIDIFLVKLNIDSLLVNIDEMEKSSVFNPLIFPNPARNKIFIEIPSEIFEKNIKIVLWNNSGQKIIRPIRIEENIIEIPVKGLNKGVYFISLSIPKHPVITKKIVIAR
ncbi:MAG: T9SS type A sorting domain-containing protein [Bacteroidetes bacterium]|nr:T9SS type A sorting domain-containing protein [Bacteroidota bacterium]MBL7105101.1 T9SS type A sorting domain-containing protein [Bacteroidales bacterium]